MSVRDFQKTLRSEVSDVAEEQGWSLDNNVQRGYSFQLWVARIISNYELNYDTEPEDALLKAKDLKADLVFDDPASKHILICQCKYDKLENTVNEEEVNDFFHRHMHFLNRAWVVKHGSSEARLALQDYAERIANGYTATYYFISTAGATDRVRDLAQKCTEEYREAEVPISCELLDFSRLKDYYIRSLSVEQSLPDSVDIDLPEGQFFYKDDPYPTIVAVVKGNALRNLSKQFKQALYAWNIRGYLGNRGINEGIAQTAQKDPANFFYFNNGVSAICTDLDRRGNRITAKKFQIINGAQTVSTLANLPPDNELEVLFRLTKTASVSTEKGFNRQVIQFNNSQNTVRLSDFRSNDPIQLFLERELPAVKHAAWIPKIHYIRKRAVGRKGLGHGLRLEDLAKLRYAFLYEPTLVHASPKDLWTLEEDGGVYERAFGVSGELADVWTEDSLNQCILAIGLLPKINDVAKKLGKQKGESDVSFLPRLKYHAISLLGSQLRDLTEDEIRRLVRSQEAFEVMWAELWPVVKNVVIDVYSTAEEESDEGVSMFAFLRSAERWGRMKKRLLRLRIE